MFIWLFQFRTTMVTAGSMGCTCFYRETLPSGRRRRKQHPADAARETLQNKYKSFFF